MILNNYFYSKDVNSEKYAILLILVFIFLLKLGLLLKDLILNLKFNFDYFLNLLILNIILNFLKVQNHF